MMKNNSLLLLIILSTSFTPSLFSLPLLLFPHENLLILQKHAADIAAFFPSAPDKSRKIRALLEAQGWLLGEENEILIEYQKTHRTSTEASQTCQQWVEILNQHAVSGFTLPDETTNISYMWLQK